MWIRYDPHPLKTNRKVNTCFKKIEVCMVKHLWWPLTQRRRSGKLLGEGSRQGWVSKSEEYGMHWEPYRAWYTQREHGVPGGSMRDEVVMWAGAGPGRAQVWPFGFSFGNKRNHGRSLWSFWQNCVSEMEAESQWGSCASKLEEFYEKLQKTRGAQQSR